MWIILTIMIVVTGGVIAFSLVTKKTYEASTTVIYNPGSTVLQPSEASATERQLATFQKLVTTPAVISTAAKQLSEPPSEVKSAITASVDSAANIINVSAIAHESATAAARANAVAKAFVTTQQQMQDAGTASARAQLQAEIAKLRREHGPESQINALQERISALQINAAGTTSSLQIVEYASPPGSPSAPHITTNVVIAVFASLLIGMLVVLARDQLTPSFRNPRDLTDALGVSALAGIPYRARTGRRRKRAIAALEHEGYDALQASLRLLTSSSERPRMLAITSAVHGEGKTTVSAHLGRSLARAGQRTLIISTDLRVPALHEHFHISQGPGLADCLVTVNSEGELPATALSRCIVTAPDSPKLDILPTGQIPADASSLISSRGLAMVFDAVRALNYDYVLLDCPPLLGLGDTQFVVRHADRVLLVGRLDRVTPYQAEDVATLVDRLQLDVLGLVIIGARVELSPYYRSDLAQAGTAVR